LTIFQFLLQQTVAILQFHLVQICIDNCVDEFRFNGMTEE